MKTITSSATTAIKEIPFAGKVNLTQSRFKSTQCNKAKLFALFIILLLWSSAAMAATRTSTATGGSWGTGSTWIGGVAPANTDDVVIATTGTNSVTGASTGTTYTCSSLTINSGSILTMQRDFK